MKIALVSDLDARDIEAWSGTAYQMARLLMRADTTVEFVDKLSTLWPHKLLIRLKELYYKKIIKKTYIPAIDSINRAQYAKIISQKLSKIRPDVIFSIGNCPISRVKTNVPILIWGDASFPGLVNYYPIYSNLCKKSIHDYKEMEQSALDKCTFAVFSSEWAKKTAIDNFSVSPEKLQVVPFGANLASEYDSNQINEIINSRSTETCNILFVGVDWYRKGADDAIKIAEELNARGLKTTLSLLGCLPPNSLELPSYVKNLGFVSKKTADGKGIVNEVFKQAHFLILPTRADCTPIVIAEANSFGVPCLATDTGGLPSMITNNKNGFLFAQGDINGYCDKIRMLFSEQQRYRILALSAYKEYKSRLNWQVSGDRIHELLRISLRQ